MFFFRPSGVGYNQFVSSSANRKSRGLAAHSIVFDDCTKKEQIGGGRSGEFGTVSFVGL